MSKQTHVVCNYKHLPNWSVWLIHGVGKEIKNNINVQIDPD